MDNFFNTNSTQTDFAKVFTGLQGARDLLNKFVTPELLQQMTPEQRAEYDKAMKMSDKDELKSHAKKLEDLAVVIKNSGK